MKKITIIIVACAVFAGAAAGAGTYYFVSKNKAAQINEKKELITKLEGELEALKKADEVIAKEETTSSSSSSSPSSSSSSSAVAKNTPNAAVVANATSGWQTYTNRDIGYILKYPQGWTLQETDKWGDDNKHYRYVTINNQDNSIHPISVHWGFVRNGTYLYSTDRTGIGAGEITEVASTIPIIGASIKKTKLTFEGKVKEHFYTPKTQPSEYTWEASIATRDEVNNTATNNLADYSEVDMAEAILSNVTLMF